MPPNSLTTIEVMLACNPRAPDRVPVHNRRAMQKDHNLHPIGHDLHLLRQRKRTARVLSPFRHSGKHAYAAIVCFSRSSTCCNFVPTFTSSIPSEPIE